MTTGKFIVIEGPDGSGKSTLAKKLVEELNAQGRPTILVREPGGCAISESIRGLALSAPLMKADADTRMLLMFASRVQLCKETIAPAIAQGINVVCDRYYISTGVYQVLGEGADSCLFSDLINYVLKPTKLFVVKAPFDVCYQRTLDRDQKDRNGYDDVSLGKKKRFWEYYNKLGEDELYHLDLDPDNTYFLDSEKSDTASLVAQVIENL